VGRFAVEQPLARGVPAPDVAALVCSPPKAVSLAGRGVQVREADYSRPETLDAALAGVSRLLLVSSSQAGRRVAQHANVIAAAKSASVSRVAYTSMLNADDSTSPLAGEHRDTERMLRESGVPFTAPRDGYYTEVYTDALGQYLNDGEILGAAGHGRLTAAPRPDYSAAAASALLHDHGDNRIYELGRPAFATRVAAGSGEALPGQVSHRGTTAARIAVIQIRGQLQKLPVTQRPPGWER
jgi:NAD(P)H dehydrogenase (quinone)